MRRGESGISCVVGVDKPLGQSSHDVVNAVRRAFCERRVGHAGTLDPLATGALVVCVGPATRLNAYLATHDKAYEARIAFGVATDTDDAQGVPVRTTAVPLEVYDRAFSSDYVRALVGRHRQLPPTYSAIKQKGVKAYEAARSGNAVHLEARDVEIYGAELLDLEEDPLTERAWWDVRLVVSKGTYIRSLARDVGAALDSAAHVASLRRVRTGPLDVESCVTLDELEACGLQAALDPVFLLGFRVAFISDAQAKDVSCGRALPLSALEVFEASCCCGALGAQAHSDSRTVEVRKAEARRLETHEVEAQKAEVRRANEPVREGECISLVFESELRAIYVASPKRGEARPSCVFSQGVIRGKDL